MTDVGNELSRNELLQWVNNLTKLSITRIQILGNGVAYCLLLELLHPGKMNMSKVHWKAKSQYEFISNFKLLQQTFLKVGLTRNIDINKLVKCKYQDNLDFLQWFKRMFDKEWNVNLEERRNQLQIPHLQDKNKSNTHINNISAIRPGVSINHSTTPQSLTPTKMTKRHTNSSFQDVLKQLSLTQQQPIGRLENQMWNIEKQCYAMILERVEAVMSLCENDENSERLVRMLTDILLKAPQEVQIPEGLRA